MTVTEEFYHLSNLKTLEAESIRHYQGSGCGIREPCNAVFGRKGLVGNGSSCDKGFLS